MIVTQKSLTEHFGLLGNDELLEQFQSGDLTDFARGVAAAELRRRQIDTSAHEGKPPAPPAAPPTPPVESPALPVAPPPAEELTADSEDLLLVARLYNPVDAYLLQSRLDAEGVPAIVADALTYQNMPFGAIIGGVRVLVPESYFERAVEIKKEIDRGDCALDEKADVG